jgi:hypothetical protein
LISDVTPLPASRSPLVHPTAEPQPAEVAPVQAPTETPVLPVVAAALAVLVLLGLGAGRELRGRRRWRALRSAS